MKFKVTKEEFMSLLGASGVKYSFEFKGKDDYSFSMIGDDVPDEIILKGEPVVCEHKDCTCMPEEEFVTEKCCDNGNFSDDHKCQKEKPKKIEEIASPTDFDWVTTGVLLEKINEMVKHINATNS